MKHKEVELNITPIIDCFTVLITFLLASASFLSIGFLEASTPGAQSDSQAQESNTEVVVKIKSDHSISLKAKGKKNFEATVATKDIKQAFKQFEGESIKLGPILMTAEDSVDYKTIASVMEELNQTNFPVVLGAF